MTTYEEMMERTMKFKSDLTDKTLEQIRNALPPVFGRSAVGKLLPGIISPGYLANLAFKKQGPEFIRVGKKAVYTRESFLDWIEDRVK